MMFPSPKWVSPRHLKSELHSQMARPPSLSYAAHPAHGLTGSSCGQKSTIQLFMDGTAVCTQHRLVEDRPQ